MTGALSNWRICATALSTLMSDTTLPISGEAFRASPLIPFLVPGIADGGRNLVLAHPSFVTAQIEQLRRILDRCVRAHGQVVPPSAIG